MVTGAGGGIGRATAALLHSRGARVALLDVRPDRLSECAEQLTGDAPSVSCVVDVADRDAVSEAVADVERELGRPSVLVNSVGWLGPLDRTVWQYDPAEWQTVFDVNLNGPVNCVRAVLPRMMQAAPEPCHIVNVASTAGIWAERRAGAYGAAKHALVAYTETLEAQLQPIAPTIGISLVCPGAVPTNLNLSLRNAGDATEWRQPEEVAEPIVRAIERGDFYVFTHESTEARYRAYLSRIFAAFRSADADQDSRARVPRTSASSPL
ncbi:SDR family oxidoreductase [Dactylosporangium sp. NPDC000244]|uniref:SDR family NAD(P)-dependent oxidoreductase n=1 Tax=Dactylosporangium sp. NPDC000244 TaxID=3154365 RepID=UPI003325C386